MLLPQHHPISLSITVMYTHSLPGSGGTGTVEGTRATTTATTTAALESTPCGMLWW